MRIYHRTFIIFLLLVSSILARGGDGGYAGAFLRMGMGARARAMGDAFTAIPQGAVAAFYNPALLPHLKERQFNVSFSFMSLDRKLDYVGYAQSLQPKASDGEGKLMKAGFSLAWIHAGVDNIDGRDLSGNSIGELSNSEHAFYMSFAVNPVSIFSIGISGKVLYNRFPKIAQEDKAVSATGFGIDVGAFLTPMPNLMFGLVLRDNMSKYTWNTDKLWERGTSTTYRFPKILRAAVAYRIPQEWLLVTAEVEDSEEQLRRFHLGAEVSFRQVGAIRLGLDDLMPTFGLGLYVDLFGREASVNYSFVAERYGPGFDHIFSWTFNL